MFVFLFYQPMDEKIKTWTLSFPTKKTPNIEKALFDWPIVLQYDVKAKYRLISRKFLGIKFFHPSVRLTNQEPPRLYPWDKPIKLLYFRSFVVYVFFPSFSLQGHTKIALTLTILFTETNLDALKTAASSGNIDPIPVMSDMSIGRRRSSSEWYKNQLTFRLRIKDPLITKQSEWCDN